MKKETSIELSAPAEAVVAKQLGRPSNPNSKRQAKLAAREAAKAAGTFRKGRPSVAGSKRQAVLAARAEKIAAGIEIKRGRPKAKVVTEDLVTLERGEVEVDTLIVPEEVVEVKAKAKGKKK
jgi:hypothetical protein